jgi:large repetitive protein
MSHFGRRRTLARHALGGLAALAVLTVVASAPAAEPSPPAASDCPSSNPPNMLAPADGSPQSAQLGKPFQTNLQVVLANSNGCPVTGSLAGIAVVFVAPSGGASGSFAASGTNEATVGTNTQGIAVAPTFNANGVAGSFIVAARSAYGNVDLSLTNTARGVAAAIAATGARAQSAVVDRTYLRPLRAHVLDADGRPVPGVTVTFALPAAASGAGATFIGGAGQATAITDDNGEASSPRLQANGSTGRFTATASVAQLAAPVAYALRNVAGRPAAIKAGAANDEATAARSRFPIPLAVTVTDAGKNPVPGALVTFAAPAHGPTGRFTRRGRVVRVRTDSKGIAVAPAFVANATAGGYVVTATVTGTRLRTAFALVNRRPAG